jgi:Nuclease-related domain
MAEPTRSPIKDKPLRLPGQSLEEERAALLTDKVEVWLWIGVFLLLMAGWEWFRYWRPQPSSPWVVTVAAVVVCIFVALRIMQIRPRLRALQQGIDGEKAVGQFLDRMREQGYQVFHDVLGGGFNVDHVLIGPGGVFTIETKTWSKPARGDARVTYDGIQLLVAGHAPDRDPLVQAKSQAGWMATLLFESTGRQFPVQPVVVFPGWFIDPSVGKPRSVWVLEPKALPGYLARQTDVIAADDVKLAAFHLSRFIRAVERQR